MATLPVPDQALLQAWLQQFEIDFYLCGSCEGLHLPILQDHPVVYDAKVEIEGDFVYLTASIEMKPSSLLQANAELGRLNSQYPTLKIFIDINDESLPRLILAHNLALQPGMSEIQFEFFVRDCLDQMHQICDEIGNLQYHFVDEGNDELSPEPHLPVVQMH
ncbi:MAG: YbjN domain-containing protein [Ferrimonas sp.]